MNQAEKSITEFRERFEAIEREVGKVIVGTESVIRDVLVAFFAGGHVLVEGAPGLGKTLLVKTVSRTLGLDFKRIQFTPDLMPSDIVGVQILTESEGSRDFRFRKGPIFANVVLADEINRATPKTQSAVLEAMEERQVTAFGETHRLDEPFFVLATQNPIELEGTYLLPEAQLDRFLAKLVVEAPSGEELKEILRRTTSGRHPQASVVLDPATATATIATMRALVREVVLAGPLEDWLVGLVLAATPGRAEATERVGRYVRYGPGPRGAQAVLLAAKVHALLDGRGHVALEDLERSVVPALRHRLVVNYQAEAEDVPVDDVIEEVRRSLPRP